LSGPFLVVAGLALGLAAAAFFAACEGAFVALAQHGESGRGHAGSRPARGETMGLRRLLRDPERLQHAIAIGHLVSVGWIAALTWLAVATRLGTRPAALSPWTWIALVLLTAFVVHVAGEQVPKALAHVSPRGWARGAEPALLPWHVALLPVTSLAAGLAGVVSRAVGSPPPAEEAMTSREVQTMVAETSARAEIEAEERQMITSIFAFGETTAREVMTPRTGVFALEVETSIDEAVRRAREAEHSRIPVYRGTLDAIVGLLQAKDLLAIAHGIVPSPPSLGDLLREVTFVPEGKKIDDLLRELQRDRVHMAIVADEYGGTAGIVTIEDILEELVGEIQDEYDREAPLVVPLPDGALSVDGRLDADDFNELTGSDLDTEGSVETIGGLVARELAHVPQTGEAVRIGPWTFLVETVEAKRVTRVRAWRPEPEEEEL